MIDERDSPSRHLQSFHYWECPMRQVHAGCSAFSSPTGRAVLNHAICVNGGRKAVVRSGVRILKLSSEHQIVAGRSTNAYWRAE